MALDPRIVRVGVEVGGQLQTYSELWVTAVGTKYANPLQNECTVKIANLARDVRDYLLTETSPFNANRTPKRLRVEAGRESTGVFLLFEGDITECAPSQAPDITLTLKAKTGQFSKGDIVAVSQGAQTSLSAIAADAAARLGLDLQFDAPDRSIANYSFTGSALRNVAKLAEVGGVRAYVDDRTLVVQQHDAPRAGSPHVLSEATGMVGLPEPTEQGVRVKYLLDPQSRLGGELRIESVTNPAASGRYLIYKLGFEVATRDIPFYSIAEASRL